MPPEEWLIPTRHGSAQLRPWNSMTAPHKIVLHSLQSYPPDLDVLVADWIRQGVRYVGVNGVDAAKIEDAIDEACVGDGSTPYFVLTASHGADEALDDVVFLAQHLPGDLSSSSMVASSIQTRTLPA